MKNPTENEQILGMAYGLARHELARRGAIINWLFEKSPTLVETATNEVNGDYAKVDEKSPPLDPMPPSLRLHYTFSESWSNE